MKKLILISTLFSLLSCNNQSDKKIINESSKAISYRDWNNSIKSTINSSNLKNFEKTNFIMSANMITKEDFLKLNSIIKAKGIGKEYYLFDVLEGEINSTTLYCIKENDNYSYVSKITIKNGQKQFSPKELSKKLLFSELVRNKHSLKYDYKILITRVLNNNVSSFLLDIDDEIIDFLN